MRPGGHSLLAAFASLALALGLPAAVGAIPAAAYQPQLIDLHVAGGEDAWHPDNDFRLSWARPPGGNLEFPVSAVHYRVRDAAGSIVVGERRTSEEVSLIDHIHVPSVPGRYTADVWFEGRLGATTPAESAALRFDDRRPGSAQPLAPPGWIGATSSPTLRIEHPAAPLPISGIHGYAVSIDRNPAGSPCLAVDRCSEAETDLRGGIDDDSAPLGTLPEGTSIVHVAAVSGSGMRSATTGSVAVRVDATRPEVGLQGVPKGWTRGPVRLTARASDWLSGMTAAGPIGPFTAIAIDGDVPRSAAGDSVSATVTGTGTHRVVATARDAAGNLSAGGPGQPPSPVALVQIDEEGPAVAFARSQDPSEPERIEATIADPLSGPSPARGAIAVRAAGTRRQFTPLPTAVAAGKLVAFWDSDAFAAGDYEFRATGYDAVGNSTDSERRATGTRMVLPSPLKKTTAIQAGFGRERLVWHRCSRAGGSRRCRREAIEAFERRPAERAVPYGRGVPFSGRLISAAGSPLDGLSVQVVETFEPGADPTRRVRTVATAADGTFRAHLRPGPSRDVEAVFAGSRVLSRSAGRQLHLAVLAGVRMHASAATARVGGPPVVFSGRLESGDALMPATGRPVALQFHLSGGEWSEFRTVQTDARGSFRYPYAFSDDDSRGVRFQFRAYAPAQDNWPYEPAASRPLFVTGR
jgi:hypothetical protein